MTFTSAIVLALYSFTGLLGFIRGCGGSWEDR